MLNWKLDLERELKVSRFQDPFSMLLKACTVTLDNLARKTKACTKYVVFLLFNQSIATVLCQRTVERSSPSPLQHRQIQVYVTPPSTQWFPCYTLNPELPPPYAPPKEEFLRSDLLLPPTGLGDPPPIRSSEYLLSPSIISAVNPFIRPKRLVVSPSLSNSSRSILLALVRMISIWSRACCRCWIGRAMLVFWTWRVLMVTSQSIATFSFSLNAINSIGVIL